MALTRFERQKDSQILENETDSTGQEAKVGGLEMDALTGLHLKWITSKVVLYSTGFFPILYNNLRERN